MTVTLVHPSGRVRISGAAGEPRTIEVELPKPGTFSPLLRCETRYPDSLIDLILQVKTAPWLCDEIARDEDPAYVLNHLETEMRAFFSFHDLDGKKILDFGCGSGASTMCLARLFPKSQIVGVELETDLLRIAEARRQHYGFDNVDFVASESGTELPSSLDRFDLVVLSAVYEHLLPDERGAVLPALWNLLEPNGIMFLDQTPHRYFPIEQHTTSLPLINYLPDSMAFAAAKRFSKRVGANDTWEELLRAGIRGATEGEIRKHLHNAEPLSPSMNGIRDGVDLWYETTNRDRRPAAKKAVRLVLKTLHKATGITLVPELTLAYRKKL